MIGSARCWTVGLALLLVARAASAAPPAFTPGTVVEYRVEIPEELKDFDRSGRPMSAEAVRVSVALPVDFDPQREWPVLLVSAASEATSDSNRALLQTYLAPAFLAGYVVVATEPSPAVKRWEDNVSLRFVEALLAMDSLHDAWRHAGTSRLAFAGTGGGAKLSGLLATMFATQGANVAGVFEAGEEQESLIAAAMQFGVLLDPKYLSIPFVMYLGAGPDSAEARRLEATQATLRGKGFRHVEVRFGPATDPSGATALQEALSLFRDLGH